MTKSRKQRKLKIEDSAAADEVLLQDIVKMETVDDQDNELVLNNVLENIDQKTSSKQITIENLKISIPFQNTYKSQHSQPKETKK